MRAVCTKWIQHGSNWMSNVPQVLRCRTLLAFAVAWWRTVRRFLIGSCRRRRLFSRVLLRFLLLCLFLLFLLLLSLAFLLLELALVVVAVRVSVPALPRTTMHFSRLDWIAVGQLMWNGWWWWCGRWSTWGESSKSAYEWSSKLQQRH